MSRSLPPPLWRGSYLQLYIPLLQLPRLRDPGPASVGPRVLLPYVLYDQPVTLDHKLLTCNNQRNKLWNAKINPFFCIMVYRVQHCRVQFVHSVVHFYSNEWRHSRRCLEIFLYGTYTLLIHLILYILFYNASFSGLNTDLQNELRSKLRQSSRLSRANYMNFLVCSFFQKVGFVG